MNSGEGRFAKVVLLLCFATFSATGWSVTEAGGAAPSVMTQGEQQQFLAEVASAGPEENTIGQAMQVLVQQCMVKKGLRYFVSPLPVVAILASNVDSLSALGSQSMASRRMNGYGQYNEVVTQEGQTQSTTPGVLGAAPTDPETLYQQSLSPNERTIYEAALAGAPDSAKGFSVLGMGTVTAPTSGCFAKSESELFGSVGKAIASSGLGAITSTLSSGMSRDPSYSGAMRKWSACMARAGYRDSTPAAAQASMAHTYAATGPTPANKQLEISISISDLTCQEQMHLLAKVHRAEDRAVGRLSGNEVGQVDQLIQNQRDALIRAQQILAHP
jgi:hypothetical protein